MKNSKNSTYNQATNCGNGSNKTTNGGMNYSSNNSTYNKTTNGGMNYSSNDSTYDQATDCGNCGHCDKK